AGAGRVLDLGAGAGRACLALQRRGADVTALDVSPGATEVCRQRGVHQTFTGTVADLAQTGPEPFGTFLMLGNNIGLLGGAGTAGAMLATLGRMATTGARIVGESFDPYATDDPAHLAYQEDNRRRGRLGGQVRLRIRHRLTATPWRDYLLCTPGELAALVAGTGWELVDAASPGPSGSAGGQWLAILQWRG
ncbi:MAG: class I SAM-dependent methyltransferase, partial [Acidimicrobiales bacterium]